MTDKPISQESDSPLETVIFSPARKCSVDEIIQCMRLCNIATVRARLIEVQKKPAVWSIVGPIVLMLFDKEQ
jgi:hypothetical protein